MSRTVRPPKATKTLTIVNYDPSKTAVYQGDRLLHYGSVGYDCFGLLKSLGYAVDRTLKLPGYHELKQCPEFETDANGWWCPPASLAELLKKTTEWRARERQERISLLRHELVALETRNGDQ